MSKYTFQQVRDTIVNVAAEQPDDFRYVSASVGVAQAFCFYSVAQARRSADTVFTEDDTRLKTGCLVGSAFTRLGEDVDGWCGSIGQVLTDQKTVDIATLEWLQEVQRKQDTGHTWKNSIKMADNEKKKGR